MRPIRSAHESPSGDEATARPQRDGTSRVERLAAARVRAHVASMPASMVVQLALWPDELARWARAERVDESVVYNMLGHRKPYLRIRERLAARLGVQTGVLARLVDGPPHPLDGGEGSDARAASDAVPPPAGSAPRDGTNPIEQRAVRTVEAEVAAMPAATVVGLVLWPTSITAWARENGLHPSAVWAALAGAPSEGVLWPLARRLGVSARELVALAEAERRPAGALAPLQPSPGAALPANAPTPVADASGGAAPAAASPGEASDGAEGALAVSTTGELGRSAATMPRPATSRGTGGPATLVAPPPRPPRRRRGLDEDGGQLLLGL